MDTALLPTIRHVDALLTVVFVHRFATNADSNFCVAKIKQSVIMHAHMIAVIQPKEWACYMLSDSQYIPLFPFLEALVQLLSCWNAQGGL